MAYFPFNKIMFKKVNSKTSFDDKLEKDIKKD